MGNVKISQLPAAGTITGTELVELVQGGSSVRSTVSNITVSSSFAQTASYALNASAGSSTSASWASSSISSSYANAALSASYLSPNQPYSTLSTSSLNWITCSFNIPNYVLNLSQTGSYSFTSSNNYTVGYVADSFIYINHSATGGTSSFLFPNNWYNIGTGWPSIIAANTIALIWLRYLDNGIVIGSYGVSGSVLFVAASNVIGTVDSSSVAVSASYAINGGGSGTTLVTASTYPITSSWATNVVNGSTYNMTSSIYGTASWATNAVTVNTANTSSYLSVGIPIFSNFNSNTTSGSSPYYLSFGGFVGYGGSGGGAKTVIPRDMTINNLYISCYSTVVLNTTQSFALNVNGAATSLSASILYNVASSVMSASNTTTTIKCSAGDVLVWQWGMNPLTGSFSPYIHINCLVY